MLVHDRSESIGLKLKERVCLLGYLAKNLVFSNIVGQTSYQNIANDVAVHDHVTG